jgi:DNA-binding NarL/FixJ family response regulator
MGADVRKGGTDLKSVLLLSDDLIDASRVGGAARDHGASVKSARDLAGLTTLARQESPRLVIVDLANGGLSIAALLEMLHAACPQMPRVVAYGPHVNADLLRAARQAGCDLVLPRSAFAEQLPHQLPVWLAPPAADREE